MKLTVPAALLTTSITAASTVDHSGAKEAVFGSNRKLAVSLEDRFEVTSILKERRASKSNGKVLRNLLQRKLRSSQLSNVDEQNADISEDLDVGLFSRSLQSNATDFEEEETVMEGLIALCEAEVAEDDDFVCTCSNINLDDYTASISCVYSETCLAPTEDICGSEATFCFEETYNLDVTGPGTGSSAICYEINSPMEFQYCYSLMYANPDSSLPTGCAMEADGTTCNSCSFYVDPLSPNITCNVFDCDNADSVIGSGIICGDDTIVTNKIEHFLTYSPLPCEYGCNICPLEGEMEFLDNNVTMVTGDIYACWQLNLAAQAGYLRQFPGDLCSSLPVVVNEPCGCSSGGITTDGTTTVVTTTEPPVAAPTSPEKAWTDPPVASPTETPKSDPSPTSDSTVVKSGFAFASAVLTTAFSWLMI